jgi:hypothetical protein
VIGLVRWVPAAFTSRSTHGEPNACSRPKSDEDFEYTLSNFDGLPEFFARAAEAGRHVVFTSRSSV